MPHERFRFKTADDLKAKARELGLTLPWSDDPGVLLQPFRFSETNLPNRLVVQPMEGFDGTPEGAPSEQAFRRYRRYAEGGSGMIWFEATSIMKEGRSNPRQLVLTKETAGEFSRLLSETRQAARRSFGEAHEPFMVLQLTHSGRFSKPEGKSLNRAFFRNPFLESTDQPPLFYSDSEIDHIGGIFERGIDLAYQAGFDAVDIKVSHGYLLHELLAGYTRTDSRYGGTLDNRLRLLTSLMDHPSPILKSCRLSATDLLPYPYGFGMSHDGSMNINLSETLEVISRLRDRCRLWNITAGIPYRNPEVNRPFDRAIFNGPAPNEHPLEGVVRLIRITEELQNANPDLVVVGSGYSWLRQFFPMVGAGVIAEGKATLIGLGRSSFAYPDAPRDLMRTGKLHPARCCVTCSRCTEFMRQGVQTGCAVRDPEYGGHEPNMKSGRTNVEVNSVQTLVIGSGAAALNAALCLWEKGIRDLLIVTENWGGGTSNNAGSDKQTYYKLSLDPMKPDSALEMAEDLFRGGSMHGDIALCEAQHSVQAFYRLVEMGVPFPHDEYGSYPGYLTDHDPKGRATSAGPLTSQWMFRSLARRVKEYGIPVLDKVRIIHLLTRGAGRQKRVSGAVGIRLNAANYQQPLLLFNSTNIILATGGPAGLYQASVYPVSQTGSIGIALKAGAVAQNLTESQFGIASIKFRWNLSGSYQQVMPAYFSTDQAGGDARDFLADHFSTTAGMCEAIFLKGYQWPFDPRKISGGGSSLIDLLVYHESVSLGRRVFIDYRRNPWDRPSEPPMLIGDIPEVARQYLDNSGALLTLPCERLQKLNAPALKLFRDHGIDLKREPLEIAICAQHNNGGLKGDIWWESNLKGLFPVGEVNGSHGVYRPGGSALNSGQVGGIRAAMRISRQYRKPPCDEEQFLIEHESQLEKINETIQSFQSGKGKLDPSDIRREIQALMSASGAAFRSPGSIDKALQKGKKLYHILISDTAPVPAERIPEALQTLDLCLTHLVYLTAIRDYIRRGGSSRGSFVVSDDPANHSDIAPNTTRSFTDCHIQEIRINAAGSMLTKWVEIRPIPKAEHWFENLWHQYRKNYK